MCIYTSNTSNGDNMCAVHIVSFRVKFAVSWVKQHLLVDTWECVTHPSPPRWGRQRADIFLQKTQESQRHFESLLPSLSATVWSFNMHDTVTLQCTNQVSNEKVLCFLEWNFFGLDCQRVQRTHNATTLYAYVHKLLYCREDRCGGDLSLLYALRKLNLKYAQYVQFSHDA